MSNTHLQSKFEKFLDLNKISQFDNSDGDSIKINSPWGDNSLAIFVPQDESELDELASVLNSILLPEEFSAILHVETEELEVLWTAYKLKPHADDVRNRCFEISWNGIARKCYFARASEAVVTLAKHCVPVSNAGATAHRNIPSFNLFAREVEHPMLDEPITFRVDCSGLDDSERINFIRHLNSYMIYFDRRSPRVLIHAAPEKKFETIANISGEKFPKIISAKVLDANLVSYWTEAFNTVDPIMRYLLLYRIVEYASFNFLDGEVIREIRRELSNPALLNNIDATARKVAEAFNRSKELEAIPRTQNMIAATVDLKKLWACIEINKDYFRADHEFDGGYVVKALLSGKCDYDHWSANAIRSTFDRLRMLRNALAHGQDGSTRGTIRPTKSNEAALVPWLNVLETIAADAMFLQDHS